MDVVATYGPMIVAAVICEAAGIVAMFFLATCRLAGADVPKPWDGVLFFSIFAPAIIAGVGAAALVGPSSDLANFIRAVVGVLAGVAACSVIGVVILQDPANVAAIKYIRKHPGDRHGSSALGPRAAHRPSAGLIAGNVLLLWVVAPVAGVIIAVVIASSWIATIGAILALASLLGLLSGGFERLTSWINGTDR